MGVLLTQCRAPLGGPRQNQFHQTWDRSASVKELKRYLEQLDLPDSKLTIESIAAAQVTGFGRSLRIR